MHLLSWLQLNTGIGFQCALVRCLSAEEFIWQFALTEESSDADACCSLLICAGLGLLHSLYCFCLYFSRLLYYRGYSMGLEVFPVDCFCL